MASAGLLVPSFLKTAEGDAPPTHADQLLAASIWTSGILQGDSAIALMQKPLHTLESVEEALSTLERKTNLTKEDLYKLHETFNEGLQEKRLMIQSIVKIQTSVASATQALTKGASDSLANDASAKVFQDSLAAAIESISPLQNLSAVDAEQIEERAGQIVQLLAGLKKSADQSQVSTEPDPAIFAPSWGQVRDIVDRYLHRPGYIVIGVVYVATKAAHVIYASDKDGRATRIASDLQSWPLRVASALASTMAGELAKI